MEEQECRYTLVKKDYDITIEFYTDVEQFNLTM